MITQDSIDKLLDTVDLVKLIGKDVKLTKRGANYTGCCPFHDEKTPSFSVSPAKEIYKCFGCGAAGNAIKFVMEKERLDYPEALRWLAKEFNVTLVETEQREEDKIVKEKRAELVDLNKAALKRYQESLLDLPADHWAVKNIIDHRMLTNSSIIEFQLGYAPVDRKFITKRILDSGYFEQASEIGLVKRREGYSDVYDVFRDRIMFPIHDEKGNVIAFGGRKKDDGNKDNPKYINSKESMLYKKSEVLYGLFQARRTIIKLRTAILVEGNVDVIMMHQAGLKNTVAACGTALTQSHAQKLKKYCDRVILMFDGDNAGKEATAKAIDILLHEGLKVQVVNMPKNDDPDELIKFHYPECCIETETAA